MAESKPSTGIKPFTDDIKPSADDIKPSADDIKPSAGIDVVAGTCAGESAKSVPSRPSARGIRDGAKRGATALISLQNLSASLASAVTPLEAADAILAYGFETLGANAGSVALLSEDGQEFTTVRCKGYPPDIEERFKRYPLATSLPNADAARTGEPLFVETLQERNRLYPHLAGPHLSDTTAQEGRGAVLALPLLLSGHVLGGISFSFPKDVTFEAHVRTSVLTVASLCALALARTRKVEAEIALRQATENSLRKSETQYRALFENSRDAICVSSHGCIRYVNAAAARMFGYGDPEELTGTVIFDLIAPASRAAIEDRQARRARGENAPDFYELRGLRKDGTEIDAEAHVSTYEMEGAVYTQAILRDITARKKREIAQKFMADASALLVSSLDIDRTLENIAFLAVPHLADWCIIHLADAQGILRPVAVSHVDPGKAAMAREAGRRYPANPHAPRGIYAVLRSGESYCLNDISDDMVRAAAQDEEHLKVLLAAGLRSFLCVALAARERRLGTITFLGAESGHRFGSEDILQAEELARRAALAVDNARLFEEANREIDERRRAEEALTESRDYYRALTEALPQLVWTTRPDGKPDYFNQNWIDYTGKLSDVNRPGSWTGIVHPDDLTRTIERWNHAVRTGEPYEIEYRLRRADGEYRWFLARGVPLKNEAGQISKWFGACTLIEDQKRAEQTQRFLAGLSEQMRPLSDPLEVLWSVVSAVGKHLGVTHCTYADIDLDKNQFTGYRNYHWKGKNDAGVYPLDHFGTEVIAAISTGQTLVVQDTRTDARTMRLYETVYQPADIRAFVLVPLLKAGRLTAALSVTMHGRPRNWMPEEVGLLEKVMEQTGLAVENAHLYQAERERSEQLRLAVSEVHHRIKNNLQAVGALLEMQVPEGADAVPIEAIRDSLGQIKTIALVHDLLSRDKPIGMVDAARVLTNLAKLLSEGMRTGEHPLSIVVDAEPVEIPTKAATALALTVNELLTNAAKHSSKVLNGAQTAEGSIAVSLSRRDDHIVVVVRDCGPGFPAGFDPARHANIGLQLVLTLIKHDLRGRVTFENVEEDRCGRSRGGRVEIVFLKDDLPS